MITKLSKKAVSVFLSFMLLLGLIPTTAFAAGADLVLDGDGYTSSYTVVFDGFEQRPALRELLAGIEGLTEEDVEITGYGNNINATSSENFAYAKIRGINGASGTSKIYFSITPFKLSNARLLRTIANFNTESTLNNLLAITSEDGTYVIPGDDIALRKVRSYSEGVEQGGGQVAVCYYMESSIIDLNTNGSYANTVPNFRGNQIRYFIVSNSANYVQDNSSVEQGYWDYGTNQSDRNNKMNEILNSLEATYFSCPKNMIITIGTFTTVSAIEFSANSPVYPDYGDGEIQWTVSSDTEGIKVQKAVCNLIVNEDADNCKVTHQIDIYFTPADGYIVADDATCAFLSQNALAQVDANTQWYKASVITTQTNAAHTWTDWQTEKEPTCTEAGERVRWCTNCGFKEVGDIPENGHTWGDWTSNGNNTHTRSCSEGDATETGNCSGGIATYYEQAVCEACGASYGDLKANPLDDVSNITDENLSKDDKTALEETKAAVEKEFADNSAEYTEEQIAELEARIDEIAGLIQMIENAEAAEEAIAALPDNVSADNGEAAAQVNAAKALYDGLTDAEKALVSKGVTEKLNGLLAQLEESGKTTGGNQTGGSDNPDTGTTTPATGDTGSITLWIAVLLLSGAALTGTAVYSRKRKYNR